MDRQVFAASVNNENEFLKKEAERRNKKSFCPAIPEEEYDIENQRGVVDINRSIHHYVYEGQDSIQLNRFSNHMAAYIKKTHLNSSFGFIMETIVMITMEECCHTFQGQRESLKAVAKLKMKIRKLLMDNWLDYQLGHETIYQGYQNKRDGNSIKQKELGPTSRIYDKIQYKIEQSQKSSYSNSSLQSSIENRFKKTNRFDIRNQYPVEEKPKGAGYAFTSERSYGEKSNLLAFQRINYPSTAIANADYDPDFSQDEDDFEHNIQQPVYKFDQANPTDWTSKTSREQFLESHIGTTRTEKRHDEDYDDDFEAAGSHSQQRAVPIQTFYSSKSVGKMPQINYSEDEDEEEEKKEEKEDQEAQDVKKKKKKKKNNKKKKKPAQQLDNPQEEEINAHYDKKIQELEDQQYRDRLREQNLESSRGLISNQLQNDKIETYFRESELNTIRKGQSSTLAPGENSQDTNGQNQESKKEGNKKKINEHKKRQRKKRKLKHLQEQEQEQGGQVTVHAPDEVKKLRSESEESKKEELSETDQLYFEEIHLGQKTAEELEEEKALYENLKVSCCNNFQKLEQLPQQASPQGKKQTRKTWVKKGGEEAPSESAGDAYTSNLTHKMIHSAIQEVSEEDEEDGGKHQMPKMPGQLSPTKKQHFDITENLVSSSDQLQSDTTCTKDAPSLQTDSISQFESHKEADIDSMFSKNVRDPNSRKSTEEMRVQGGDAKDLVQSLSKKQRKQQLKKQKQQDNVSQKIQASTGQLGAAQASTQKLSGDLPVPQVLRPDSQALRKIAEEEKKKKQKDSSQNKKKKKPQPTEDLDPEIKVPEIIQPSKQNNQKKKGKKEQETQNPVVNEDWNKVSNERKEPKKPNEQESQKSKQNYEKMPQDLAQKVSHSSIDEVTKSNKQKKRLRAQGQMANFELIEEQKQEQERKQEKRQEREEKKEEQVKTEKKVRDSSQTSTQSAPSQVIKPITVQKPQVPQKDQRLTPQPPQFQAQMFPQQQMPMPQQVNAQFPFPMQAPPQMFLPIPQAALSGLSKEKQAEHQQFYAQYYQQQMMQQQVMMQNYFQMQQQEQYQQMMMQMQQQYQQQQQIIQQQQTQQQQQQNQLEEDQKSQSSHQSQVNLQAQPFVPKAQKAAVNKSPGHEEESKEDYLSQHSQDKPFYPQNSFSPELQLGQQMQQNFQAYNNPMMQNQQNLGNYPQRPYTMVPGLPQTQILEPHDYMYNFSQDQVLKAFDNELLQFTKHITLRVKEAEVERKKILNVIKEAVKNHCFPSSQLEQQTLGQNGPLVNVFGSMQTGIAIDSSDMDILVSGNFGQTRQDLIDNMQILLDELLKFEAVASHNFIETASVPVIKIDYNLTILEISERHQTFRSMHELSQIMRLLKVDISFEQVANRLDQGPHQGRQCIQFIKDMIEKHPILQYLAIIIKKLLAHKELNKPFSGGLGSYAVVLMILAFINHKDPQGNLSISEMLLEFLDYYGNTFKPEEQQIAQFLLSGDMYIQSMQNMEHNNVNIIDPLNINNNVGKMTYNFKEIQKFFSDSHKKLLEQKNKLEDRKSSLIPSKTDFIRQVFQLSVQPIFGKKQGVASRKSQKSEEGSHYSSANKQQRQHLYDSDYLSQGSKDGDKKQSRKPSQK